MNVWKVLRLLALFVAIVIAIAIIVKWSQCPKKGLVGAWKSRAQETTSSIQFNPNGYFTAFNFPLEGMSRLALKPEKHGRWVRDSNDPRIVRLEFATERVHAVISGWTSCILTTYIGDPDSPLVIEFERQ